MTEFLIIFLSDRLKKSVVLGRASSIKVALDMQKLYKADFKFDNVIVTKTINLKGGPK